MTTTTTPATATPAQLSAFHCLLHKLALMPQKATMVGGATQGRTESSKELYIHEARDLILQLNAMLEEQDGTALRAKKMRGKIMSYAHEMKWTKTNPQGRTVADGMRIDVWMLKFSYCKKKLNAYKYAELPKLVTQFHNVYKAFLKAI